MTADRAGSLQLAQALGGCGWYRTATRRHLSSILRRIGGLPLVAEGIGVASVLRDPQYGCEMEIVDLTPVLQIRGIRVGIAQTRITANSARHSMQTLRQPANRRNRCIFFGNKPPACPSNQNARRLTKMYTEWANGTFGNFFPPGNPA
jgi:hypothetical protein